MDLGKTSGRGLIRPRASPYDVHGKLAENELHAREPPKTKSELREMLTEAVRNTQSERKRPPKAGKDRG